MSLRLRLTFLCVGLVALVLAGFALTTYFLAKRNIYNSFDDSLVAQADAILPLLPTQLTDESVRAQRPQLDTQAAAGLLFQVRSPDGLVLYSSFRGGQELLPSGRSLGAQAFFDANVAQEKLRILHQPIESGGSIEVGRSTSETAENVTEIRYALFGGGLLALFLTMIPAYFIAGRGLRPIRDVSRVARRIERTGDFSQRLEQRKSRDETGELIATFNEMIERVDQTMAAQTEFLAESSHELRRPLTILRTNLDILRDPSLPAADRMACLERMSREARAMTSLVGDLLLLTRDKAQSLLQAHVDFSALCADEVSRIGYGDDQPTLTSNIQPGLVVVGDEERLRQMVKNLLENAVTYTPKGGRVGLSLQSEGENVRLVVQDTGIGIPEAERSKVFERFYRGDQARSMRGEGVGLGLAIVKYVVEGHGGEIEATETLSGGTSFTVTLPRSTTVAEPLTETLAVS
ncbi:MAG: HAMP domain-containing sensor histidine kinase [Chloroflexota bacterium]